MNAMIRSLLRKVYRHGKRAVNVDRYVPRVGAFISIPKNASKTVLDALELGANRNVERTRSLVIYENHQRGAVLARRYPLDRLFVFCFARNPYDRCVSWYEYHRTVERYEPYLSLSFDEWVRRGMPHHWRRQNQTDFARRGLTPLLQYTFVEGVRVDFVGRMERFDEDLGVVVDRLNEICRRRGIAHRFRRPEKVAAKNTAPRQRTRTDEYYTPETREIVYSLLEKDFRHFGYEK